MEADDPKACVEVADIEADERKACVEVADIEADERKACVEVADIKADERKACVEVADTQVLKLEEPEAVRHKPDAAPAKDAESLKLATQLLHEMSGDHGFVPHAICSRIFGTHVTEHRQP